MIQSGISAQSYLIGSSSFIQFYPVWSAVWWFGGLFNSDVHTQLLRQTAVDVLMHSVLIYTLVSMTLRQPVTLLGFIKFCGRFEFDPNPSRAETSAHQVTVRVNVRAFKRAWRGSPVKIFFWYVVNWNTLIIAAYLVFLVSIFFCCFLAPENPPQCKVRSRDFTVFISYDEHRLGMILRVKYKN